MNPFEVGSRVVCPDPTGRRFVGTVHELLFNGDHVVTNGAGSYFRVSAEEVRPVMPRGPEDLDFYGDHWWCDGRPVRVEIHHIYGTRVYHCGTDCPDYEIDPSLAWAGPVQPPPVVRG